MSINEKKKLCEMVINFFEEEKKVKFFEKIEMEDFSILCKFPNFNLLNFIEIYPQKSLSFFFVSPSFQFFSLLVDSLSNSFLISFFQSSQLFSLINLTCKVKKKKKKKFVLHFFFFQSQPRNKVEYLTFFEKIFSCERSVEFIEVFFQSLENFTFV